MNVLDCQHHVRLVAVKRLNDKLIHIQYDARVHFALKSWRGIYDAPAWI